MTPPCFWPLGRQDGVGMGRWSKSLRLPLVYHLRVLVKLSHSPRPYLVSRVLNLGVAIKDLTSRE